MKRIILTALLLLSCAYSIEAQTLPDIPDHTLLWNNFESVETIDSFIVLSSRAGLMSCRYDSTSRQFVPIDYLFLPTMPTRTVLDDDILIVLSATDLLYFVDISALPKMTLLGKISLDIPPLDFELNGNDLYVAAGFDGVRRYRIDNYNSATFLDSSILPIHAINITQQNNLMMVVDDYNGVLTYDISGSGFGEFRDIFHSSTPVTDVVYNDGDYYIGRLSNGILRASWDGSFLNIVDSLAISFTPGKYILTDSLLISISPNNKWLKIVNIYNRITSTTLLVFKPGHNQGLPVFGEKDNRQLLLPSQDGGLYAIDLTYTQVALYKPVYSRAGPIRSLILDRGKLYTGGTRNPLETYMIDTDGTPRYTSTFLPTLDNLRSLHVSDDRLFALYPQAEALMELSIDSNNLSLVDEIYIDSNFTLDLKLPANRIAGLKSLYGVGNSHLDIYIFNDTLPLTKLGILSVFSGANDLEVIDSLLVISTGKFALQVYRIYDDFSLEFRSTLNMGTRLKDLIVLPLKKFSGNSERLLGFAGNQMYAFDLADPTAPSIDTIITLPISPNASVVHDSLIYLVGWGGVGTINSNYWTLPFQMLGGRGGTMIAVDDNNIAISDGSGIYIYNTTSGNSGFANDPVENSESLFNLSNYPNPFNPNTVILFTLANQSNVSLNVYNLLGRHVSELINASLASGEHEIWWDGRDSRGYSLATGLYFYRLQVNERTESRKMLLIR